MRTRINKRVEVEFVRMGQDRRDRDVVDVYENDSDDDNALGGGQIHTEKPSRPAGSAGEKTTRKTDLRDETGTRIYPSRRCRRRLSLRY